MNCDSLERRRALLEKKVECQNDVASGPRPLITDRELVEQLLRIERDMERGGVYDTPRYAAAR